MKPKLIAATLLFTALALIPALASDVSKGALNATTPGGISPKPMTLVKQTTYAIQCDLATCYKTSATLQGDGGLVTDCTADYGLAAGALREFDSAGNSYLAVNALADAGTPNCRLFQVSHNK